MMSRSTASKALASFSAWVAEVWADGWGSRCVMAMFALMLLLFAAMPLVFWKAIQEQKRWQDFALEHRCEKVAHVKGGISTVTGTSLGIDGKLGIFTALSVDDDKTAWRCDDGVTYWR